MFRRPKPGETEEDLLKEQEKWLASNRPSASAVRRPDKRKAEEPKSEAKQTAPTTSDAGKLQIGPDACVMTDIVEREVGAMPCVPPSKRSAVAFPQVMHISKKIESSGSHKQSLFARQMKSMREKQWPSPRGSASLIAVRAHPVFGTHSMVVTGSGLDPISGQVKAQEIHDENVNKLTGLSEDEILKEQSELLEVLDPNLVKFLKTRHKRNEGQVSATPVTVTTDNVSDMDMVDNEQQEFMKETSTEKCIKEQQTSSTATPQRNEVRDGEDSTLTKPMNPDDVEDENFPIPTSDAKKWLHMDKVEKEKLKWTTNLPPPEPCDPKTGFAARFDFDGMLVNRESDTPTHKGLHHHGDEPEVPGYTLEELFQYSRSSVTQQRVLGLQVIANVLKKAKSGLYDECLHTPLLPQLLESGIIPLFRWAMDDSVQASVEAAVLALRALVVSEPDEVCLDRMFSCFCGHEVPYLIPAKEITEDNTEKKDDLTETTDAELVKLDVIKGLLRMDVLPRLQYVLEKMKPPPPVVFAILELLTRISRHSTESSYAVMTKSRELIKLVILQFMPKNWSHIVLKTPLGDVYGIPLAQAAKLVRVLASNSRSLATDLIIKYHVLESLMCYCALDPSDANLPAVEALQLSIESLRAWRIFLTYGLAAEEFLDMYPLIVRQLQFYQVVSVNDEDTNHFNYEHGSALFGLLEAVVDIVASQATSVRDANQMVPSPIYWNHVESLLDPAQTCARKWLTELRNLDVFSHAQLKLVGSCLRFLSSYFNGFSRQLFYKPVKVLDEITSFYNGYVVQFLQGTTFTKLLQNLSKYSTLLIDAKPGNLRDPASLPSIGSILWGGNVNCLVEENSPISFLTDLFGLIVMSNQLHRNLTEEIVTSILSDPFLIEYTNALCSSNALTGNWFTRFETHLIWRILQLATTKCTTDKLLQHYHNVACAVLPKFLIGDEHLVQEVLTSLIFNVNFLPERYDVEKTLARLSLKSKVPLQSATQANVDVAQSELIAKTLAVLPSISTTYLNVYAEHVVKGGNKSWSHELQFHQRNHVTINANSQTILLTDWMFLPISDIYSAVKSAETLSQEKVQQILHCLQWVHLLEIWKQNVLSCVSFTRSFFHLGCIYLVCNDLFLDSNVHVYLEDLLTELIRHNKQDLDMKSPLSGLVTFRDFFSQLLTQYEAISYGDQLFGTFVLVPIQQRYPVTLRIDLWTEHSAALRFLSVSVKQLPMALNTFLQPLEKNQTLISAYCTALLSGVFDQKKCPVMYVIAIHHVHNYVFDDSNLDQKFKYRIIEHMKRPQNETLFQHFLRYGGSDSNCDEGFTLLSEVTEEKRMILNYLVNSSSA